MNVRKIIKNSAASLSLFVVLTSLNTFGAAQAIHSKKEVSEKSFQINEQVVLANEIIARLEEKSLDEKSSEALKTAQRELKETEPQRSNIEVMLGLLEEGDPQIDILYSHANGISLGVSKIIGSIRIAEHS